jgi:hypothetical protein
MWIPIDAIFRGGSPPLAALGSRRAKPGSAAA